MPTSRRRRPSSCASSCCYPAATEPKGLAQGCAARAQHGRLLQGEADYQAQIIDLWYEKRADVAVSLLTSLRGRYPRNPLFASQLADVQDRYLHDLTASLATWRALLARARDRRMNEPALAEAAARLGIAHQLDALDETDRAIEQARPVIEARPTRPYGALASAFLALGEGEDRLGHHGAAIAAYRLVLDGIGAGAPDPDNVRGRAADAMRRTPDPPRAEAYRVSLEGLRALERGDNADADALLARSLRLNPLDPVAEYRYGRAREARKDEAGALDAFEATIRAGRACPAPIAAAAFLDAARLKERLAHRDQAIALLPRRERHGSAAAPNTRRRDARARFDLPRRTRRSRRASRV